MVNPVTPEKASLSMVAFFTGIQMVFRFPQLEKANGWISAMSSVSAAKRNAQFANASFSMLVSAAGRTKSGCAHTA